VEKPAGFAVAAGVRAYLFQRAALISDKGLLTTPHRTDAGRISVSVVKRSI